MSSSVNFFLASDSADNLRKQFGPRSGPEMSVLTWVQTVRHSDSVPERIF